MFHPAGQLHILPPFPRHYRGRRVQGVINMGEQTEFEPGQRAPNDGEYIEVGEASFHTGIQNPKRIRLARGERFPETSNHRRKWKKFNS